MLTWLLTALSLRSIVTFLKQVWGWRMPVLLLLVMFLGMVVWIQLDQLKRSAEDISDLNENIRQMERAVALTERLQSRNAELREDLHDLQEQLAQAPSAYLPLPDDIRSIVNGLR